MKIFYKYNFLIACTFGLQLSRKEIAEIYGTRRIGRDQAQGLVGLMDFFCFSEVSFVIFDIFLNQTFKYGYTSTKVGLYMLGMD